MNRAAISISKEDRGYYPHLLGEAWHPAGVALHAYVLMTNHMHLLVTKPSCVWSKLR